MKSVKWIKFKSIIRQNSYALFIVFAWFVANYVAFYLLTHNLIESLLILFYFKAHNSLYGNFYDNFSDFIIFGIVFSLITVELFRKYNPTDTCRKLAKEYENHAIVIGYNEIGKRIVDYLKEKKVPVVIIEKNKAVVEEFIEKGEPLIVDDAMHLDALIDAGVVKAKAIFIMADRLELLMVTCSHIRELNKSCKLICRIFEDDVAEIIGKTYYARTISTSQYSADIILEKIKKNNYRNIVLMGLNHITARLLKSFKDMPEINYYIIEEDEEIIEDLLLDSALNNLIMGDPKELTVLEKARIKDADCVVNIQKDIYKNILITRRIRDFNAKCKIISSFTLESLAEVLMSPPFNVEALECSKNALESMIQKGIVKF